MRYITEGLRQAVILIVMLDPQVYEIVGLTLFCSFTATLIGTLFALPTGFLIGTHEFRGKNSLVTIFSTLMALPTTVVGLFGYALLSKSGPFGFLGLLFTPGAIIIGETVLCFPIIVAFAISTTQSINPLVRQTALTLGASPFQASMAVFFEGRIGYLVCVAAGFARVIAEVGAAMMLGGNIKGHTRTLTTAIALETGKGEFSLGMALGIILLILALAVNIPIQRLKRIGDSS
ncbi:MAG: ABC transporter permease [Deltaproteobacteria bacterium]|nr:ABC transporter permease [Candidatus Zymogenaceae bacterium]